jgi:hypothetical protein
MKKRTDGRTPARGGLRRDYNFTGGVHDNRHIEYRRGHTVRVIHDDGTTTVRHYRLEDGAVLLEPDVRKVFRDSRSVNRALRCLIPLVRSKSRRRVGV